MTSAVQPISDRADVRTIVGGGAVLGAVTAIGVAVFALASRPLSGATETVVQSVLILAGAAVFCYFPAVRVRPANVDGIAWSAMLGLMGALFFTVFDTVLLRPLDIYHWTWDQVGGGSGFWYIPVWWMGSATLAWLGAWITAIVNGGNAERSLVPTVATTIVIGIVVFAALVGLRIAPAHSAVMALGVTLGLPIHVLGAWLRARR